MTLQVERVHDLVKSIIHKDLAGCNEGGHPSCSLYRHRNRYTKHLHACVRALRYITLCYVTFRCMWCAVCVCVHVHIPHLQLHGTASHVVILVYWLAHNRSLRSLR